LSLIFLVSAKPVTIAGTPAVASLHEAAK